MSFQLQHAEYLAYVENSLQQTTDCIFQPDSKVSEAALYSLMNGGKRVRGVLVLAVADLLGGDWKKLGPFACGIEMVHAFSLVHDDLPCMDDDDMRRGKPANHIVFGQANALLAGDLLALEAFQALMLADVSWEQRAKAAQILAEASGARGMIYGQELDLFYETKQVDLATLESIHRHKTGALIACAAKLGIIGAGLDVENSQQVVEYADHIGLVFQIVDDILDETATTQQLGKPVGSDRQQGKNTFVTLVGIDNARKKVEELTQEASVGLQKLYGAKAGFLIDFAEQLAQRIN